MGNDTPFKTMEMKNTNKKNNNMKKFNNKSDLDQEIARVALKVLKKNQEIKSFDFGLGTTIDSTGRVDKLTTITQADTDSARDGDAARIVSFEIQAQATYADTTNVIRLVVVRWNQDDSSSAPSSVTDLFQSASAFSPYNRDNLRARKFTVIMDHLFAVSNVGPGIEKLVKRSRFVSNIAFQATATTGTGHLYSFAVSDSAASAHPGLSFIFRTYFTDS
jgi:hypothetical protein